MSKIVLFFDHTAKLGGGEIALLNLVRAIDRDRFVPVVVLGSDGLLRDRLLQAGIETHLLPLASSVTETRKDTIGIHSLLRIADIVRMLFYCVKLTAFIRRKRASVVHTNSLKADLIGGVASRLARVPVVWHIRDRIADDYLPPVAVRFFRLLCRIIPNAIIANSHATLDSLSLAPRGSQNPPASGPLIYRGSVIYDGINPSSYDTEESGSAAGYPRIGLIGRFAPWKGQHIFIRAADAVVKKYPQCRFQIIGAALFGEDEYDQQLRSLVRLFGLTNHVEFTGFRSDVAELMRQLDVVVHASTVGEPFGQVVIEAMASSKPVVATRGGGIIEIMVDGVTGILVPMGDADAMASAIVRMIENPEMAHEMGKAGKEWVKQFFTIEKTARQTEDVFTRMLARRPS